MLRVLRSLALAVLAGNAVAQATAPATWPPAAPGLAADPAIRFGRLDNGVRFAALRHDRPPRRCSLRLVVQVGSDDESDAERGAAHFVEHMAFNGTRRFPGNSIDAWFARRGMRFGLHANAHTYHGSTIYRADLPDAEPATVADGLAVLREFADGITFDAAEVAAERGVIDAEERERSAQSVEERWLERLTAGTRSAARTPIGTPASRAAFTA
jgi:zinc protease